MEATRVEVLKKISVAHHPVTYKKKYVLRTDEGPEAFHQATESLVKDGRITIAVLAGLITSIADDGQLTAEQLQVVEHLDPAIVSKWEYRVTTKYSADTSQLTLCVKMFENPLA